MARYGGMRRPAPPYHFITASLAAQRLAKRSGFDPARRRSASVKILSAKRGCRRIAAAMRSIEVTSTPTTSRCIYSTVTDLARFRGWSTSQPRSTATW